jgi:hypothetical protein
MPPQRVVSYYALICFVVLTVSSSLMGLTVNALSTPGAASQDDKLLGWRTIPVRRILAGELDSLVAIDRPEVTVATDAKGHIYILDRAARRVVQLDSQGTWLRTYGRRGNGPGELESPSDLAASTNGVVAVHDFGKRSFVLFDSVGRYISSIRLGDWLLPHAGWSDGAWIAALRVQSSANTAVHQLVRVDSTERNELVALKMPTFAPIRISQCDVTVGGVPPVFTPDVVFGSNQRMVVFAATADYKFTIWERNSAKVVTHAFVSFRPTDAIIVAEIGDTFRIRRATGTCRIDGREYARMRTVASRVNAIKRIAVSPRDEIWILRRTPRPPYAQIDVFDKEGTFLGMLHPAIPFPEAFVSADRYVATIESRLGESRLQIVRIERNSLAR